MFRSICWALAMFIAQTACAITTEFEDLPANGVYATGTTFSSGGLNFKVVPFPASGVQIGVDGLGKASGQGQELLFGRSVSSSATRCGLAAVA